MTWSFTCVVLASSAFQCRTCKLSNCMSWREKPPSPHPKDFRSRQLMRCKYDSVYRRRQYSDICPSTSGCGVP